MNRDTLSTNLVFFLLGAGVGAAVALLYAPQEGEATRRLITDKASEYKDRASELTSTVATQARDHVDRISTKAQELLNRGQVTANGAINSAEEALHSVSE